ncbi:hypothetical protein [Metabacillus sp. 84]|uniref:hypothetical protein n=1 Tax=Metabacillus sp. 84 TaxID=3404705 RepID=UPI003CF3FF12
MTQRSVQWVAFAVCIATLILQVSQLENGILAEFRGLILPVGFGAGVFLLAMSFFLKKGKRPAGAKNDEQTNA